MMDEEKTPQPPKKANENSLPEEKHNPLDNLTPEESKTWENFLKNTLNKEKEKETFIPIENVDSAILEVVRIREIKDAIQKDRDLAREITIRHLLHTHHFQTMRDNEEIYLYHYRLFFSFL